jgi:predicted GH43/DUF377 family glycosyl hydrolase
MILPRQFTRCLLSPEDVPPSQPGMKVVGAFNPGVEVVGDRTALLVRIAELPTEERPGWIPLPRWDFTAGHIVCDWVAEADVWREDTRSVRYRNDGHVRLTFASHLALFWSRDGRTIDNTTPARFLPVSALEEFGVEDPRITRIGDTYYITYVGVSVHGPATLLATTRDFASFIRHGVIFCPDNKDVVLLPEKVDGEFVALHRPSLSTSLAKPEIWTASSPDGIHWGRHAPLWRGVSGWDCGRIGAGAPPVRTKAGWLELYHGNDRRYGETRVGRYSGGLLLLDGEKPSHARRSVGPVFVPEAAFEREGFVPDVVFPTALIVRDDLASVYYGAADAVTAVVEFRMKDLEAAVA